MNLSGIVWNLRQIANSLMEVAKSIKYFANIIRDIARKGGYLEDK